jgi:hypothetical protein
MARLLLLAAVALGRVMGSVRGRPHRAWRARTGRPMRSVFWLWFAAYGMTPPEN